MLARRLDHIESSPTLAITARVAELRARGVDVIGFGAGEPDFPTPAPIVEAAVAALREGFTRYTPSRGIPELREAISRKLERDNGLAYAPDEIVVSCGAKHAMFNALMALCSEGDEVVVPAPYWVSYPHMARLAGAEPVIVPTSEDEDFKLTPAALEAALTPRTKAVIINSPANPTGAVYTRDELHALASLCVERKVWIISDEIYEKLLYEGEHHSVAALDPAFRDYTVTVNGVSKAYSMTGWRMGYSASPRTLSDAISRVQDHSTSCIASFVQKACIAAFELDDSVVDAMRAEFDKRRRRMVELLDGLPGVSCRMPHGAFYTFACIRRLIGRKIAGREVKSSMDFARVALDEARVAVVPGSAFGAEGYIRLSYAVSLDTIERGLARLAELLRS